MEDKPRPGAAHSSWKEETTRLREEICERWEIGGLKSIFQAHPYLAPKRRRFGTKLNTLVELARRTNRANAEKMIYDQIARRAASQGSSIQSMLYEDADGRAVLRQLGLEVEGPCRFTLHNGRALLVFSSRLVQDKVRAAFIQAAQKGGEESNRRQLSPTHISSDEDYTLAETMESVDLDGGDNDDEHHDRNSSRTTIFDDLSRVMTVAAVPKSKQPQTTDTLEDDDEPHTPGPITNKILEPLAPESTSEPGHISSSAPRTFDASSLSDAFRLGFAVNQAAGKLREAETALGATASKISTSNTVRTAYLQEIARLNAIETLLQACKGKLAIPERPYLEEFPAGIIPLDEFEEEDRDIEHGLDGYLASIRERLRLVRHGLETEQSMGVALAELELQRRTEVEVARSAVKIVDKDLEKAPEGLRRSLREKLRHGL